MTWQLPALAFLHWSHLDGDWAIYDEASGQTLAVDAVTAACLMALESGCKTRQAIDERVLADIEPVDPVALLEQVGPAIEFLVQIGLAVADPP